MHNPPYSDWQCCLTPGSTASWDATLRVFCERGDYILTEEYTFSTALETAHPLGIRAAAVKMDEQGLLPESLDDVLTNWDEKARGARKPYLLYTVPSGQNPTGATQSIERRREVYKVAQKHDLYIVEDEPYYFLQMQPYTGEDGPSVPAPSNHKEFLKALIPSFLSIDVDGRVLRLDSFSKVVSPGSRVAWIVASEQIVERFTRHFECSTQNPSGISQLILFKLLDEQWGHSGYLDWLINLRMQYTNRRNTIVQACEKHLPTEVASWTPPTAGMFVSISDILIFLLEALEEKQLTHYGSTGSKSTGKSTPRPLPAEVTTPSKRPSSTLPQKEMFSYPGAAGSRPTAPSMRTECFSARRLQLPRQIRSLRLSRGLVRRSGLSSVCASEK